MKKFSIVKLSVDMIDTESFIMNFDVQFWWLSSQHVCLTSPGFGGWWSVPTSTLGVHRDVHPMLLGLPTSTLLHMI